MTKTGSLTRVLAAYLIAVAAGAGWLIWGPVTAWAWLDALNADLIGTLVVFGFSRAYRNSSFYDPYWSVVPPLLLIFWAAGAPTGVDRTRLWLLSIAMVLWAVRLTANWVYAFPGLHHEDWRYPMLRDAAGRWAIVVDLFAIHVFPTLQVFAAMVPVYLAVTRTGSAVNALDLVAFLVGIGAVVLELVADLQMHRFIRHRKPGEAMQSGLWAWSRHPNYFGEYAFWVSMALFGVAAWPSAWWWSVAGAAAMLAMFLGASIPMMERRSLERRPAYADVVARVSRFVPRPPRAAGPASP